MLAQHIAPKVVQVVLGRSSLGTTINIYAHVLPELHQDAAERMDAIFAR
jgi:integrase